MKNDRCDRVSILVLGKKPDSPQISYVYFFLTPVNFVCNSGREMDKVSRYDTDGGNGRISSQ